MSTQRFFKKKVDCIICEEKFKDEGPDVIFVKPMNAMRVCKLPRCVETQNAIDKSGIVPVWHPDWYDLTKDPLFRALPTTNLESIEDEEQRVKDEDRLARRNKQLRKTGFFDDTIPANRCVVDYDGKMIATFTSSSDRSMKIQLLTAVHRGLKIKFENLLEQY